MAGREIHPLCPAALHESAEPTKEAAEQMQPPFDESWRPVIRRRSAEVDTGAVAEVPWSEVRQRLRQKVGLDG
jgi:hypothetical protein